MRLDLGKVAKVVDGKLYNVSENLVIDGVSTDSRTAGVNELFFAIKGERFDGHDFIRSAVQKGCVAVVASKVVDGVPTILVEDTMDALFKLAVFNLHCYNPRIVAVTGSYGKTTTKELIHAVLSRKYNTLKALSSYNNVIGVSKTLFAVDQNVDYVILELGTNHPGEISSMVSRLKLDSLVIISVGKTHIGNFGSIEGILEEKLSAIDGLRPDGKLFINLDNRHLRGANIQRDFYGFGKSEGTHFRILEVEDKKFDGFCFRISVDVNDSRFDICSPLIGDFNVYNAVAAFSVGWVEGVGVDDITDAIGEYRGMARRMNCWKGEGGFYLIDDTYNANPDAMRAAIRVLCSLPGSRRILVVGDMLELGRYSEIEHYAVGEYAGRMGVDEIWAVGEFADFVLEGFRRDLKEGQRAKRFGSNEEVALEINRNARGGYLFLIKGSRRCAMENIVEQVKGLSRC